MIIVLCVIGLLILWIVYVQKKCPVDKIYEETKEEYLKNGYHYIEPFFITYIGGISNISTNNKVSFTITKEGLLLLYDQKSYPCVSYSDKKLIKWDNIKNISFQTEQNIKEQVSLGKLLVFGVLAFGMKGKDKNISNEYIVLNINEDLKEYNMILQAEKQEDNQRKYNDLIEYINQFKEAN